MAYAMKDERSPRGSTGRCAHINSKTGLCACKVEMEKKYQDFKKLTGEIFKEQLREQTKDLKDFSEKLVRENLILKKDVNALRQQVDVLQKLSENSAKQNSKYEALVEKQQADIGKMREDMKLVIATVEGVTGQNKVLLGTVNELETTVQGVSGQYKVFLATVSELETTVVGLTGQNKVLLEAVNELTNTNNELQMSIEKLQENK